MVLGAVSMLFPPIDPNERFRERRDAARRRKRLRRSAVLCAFFLAIGLLGVGARFVGSTESQTPVTDLATLAAAPGSGPRTLPIELRGVHVTMAVASLPGKLDDYLDLEHDGLTALELDVKDENGEVAFAPSSVPLATSSGAARDYYAPRDVARRVHERGIYLIGRIVVFEDPVLSRARPDLAVRRSDGSVWRDSAGLGWTDPYDKRVWKYNADLAVAAARAGFDEIMFDYVRFPSDGDVGQGVFRNPSALAKRQAVPAFLRYAHGRLQKYGVRVSAAVFGLSGARDLGIGQLPKRMAPYLDTIYAMTYPSLFGLGELGLAGSRAGRLAQQSLGRFASSRSHCGGRTRSSCRGCRTSASACRTGSTRCARRSMQHASQGRRASSSGIPSASTPTARSRRPRRHGARRSALQPSGSRTYRTRSCRRSSRCSPELDAGRDDPVAAPERGQRHVVAGEAPLHLG